MLATRPPYLLALATAVALLAPPLVQRAQPKRDLTADDIIAASLAAQGGCERLAAMRELTTTGHLVDHKTGEMATLRLWSRAPRDLRMIVAWGNVDYRLEVRDDVVTIDQGTIDVVRDHQVVTGSERDSVRDHQVVTGSEREQYLIDASFACHPDAQNLYRSSTLRGITTFAGTFAYQIDRTTASGLTRTAYVAVDTLLPIGEDRVTVTQRTSWEEPGPPHVTRLRFTSSDFRWVDGVLIAFQSRQSVLEGDGFLDENTYFAEHVTID